MALERERSTTSFIDVLDRVLDKGIVIDAWMRVSLAGIDLITVDAHLVVTSIEGYHRHSETVVVMPVRRRPGDHPPGTAKPDPDDDDDGGTTPPASGGSTPAFVGPAEIMPRRPPSRRRRPID